MVESNHSSKDKDSSTKSVKGAYNYYIGTLGGGGESEGNAYFAYVVRGGVQRQNAYIAYVKNQNSYSPEKWLLSL